MGYPPPALGQVLEPVLSSALLRPAGSTGLAVGALWAIGVLPAVQRLSLVPGVEPEELTALPKLLFS